MLIHRVWASATLGCTCVYKPQLIKENLLIDTFSLLCLPLSPLILWVISLHSCSHKSRNKVREWVSCCSANVDCLGCFYRRRKATQIVFCGQNSLGWLFTSVPSVVFSCRFMLPQLTLPPASHRAGSTVGRSVLIIPIFSMDDGRQIQRTRDTSVWWNDLPLSHPLPCGTQGPVPGGGCLDFQPFYHSGVLTSLHWWLWFHNFCLSTWNAPKEGCCDLHVRNGMCYSIRFICLQWLRASWLWGVKETFISLHPHRGSNSYLGYETRLRPPNPTWLFGSDIAFCFPLPCTFWSSSDPLTIQLPEQHGLFPVMLASIELILDQNPRDLFSSTQRNEISSCRLSCWNRLARFQQQ